MLHILLILCLIVIVIFIIVIVIIGCILHSRSFDKRTHFQHNKSVLITQSTYKYVKEYKKQLIRNVAKLCKDLDIKYVISHGNLIEFERQADILHDDDLDLRFDKRDMHKWVQFCKHEYTVPNKYNIVLDSRVNDIEKQLQNGIQIRLDKFENPLNIEEHTQMDIHIDFIAHSVRSAFWKDYDIDFDALRTIQYLDTETFAPSQEDTVRILIQEYGSNYMIPNIHNYIID